MGFTYRDPERSTDPRRAVGGAQSVVVAARPYLTDTDPEHPPSDAGPHARVGRYAWVDHYVPLRQALRDVSRQIRRADHRAVAFADDNSIVDRAVAHRAGLGWYGKNANLLLPGAGSWFVLGCIVTTATYAADDGAGRRRMWHVPPVHRRLPDRGDHRPRRDRRQPMSQLGPAEARSRSRSTSAKRSAIASTAATTARTRARSRCAWGRRDAIELDPSADAWVDALELLDADDEWIDARYGHWYITDRDLRWLRRNALVVVGNVGDPSDGRVRRVVDQYRSGIDPILAEHAAWAAARLDERVDA